MKTLKEMYWKGKDAKTIAENHLVYQKEQEKVMNPKLWTKNEELIPSVHNHLVDTAEAFVEGLGIDPKYIQDVRLVGGNASYNWSDASDLDVTILLDREMDLTKEDIRRLQISANNFTFRVAPTTNGIDTNFYISSRNVGGLRPARQSIYSLEKMDFLSGPTGNPELESNFLASKANYFAEMIEECISDESHETEECAAKLLERFKRYRVKGLRSKEGEESTENLVWRILSRSGYIKKLKQKIDQLEKDFYQLKTPSALIQNEEFRLFIKEDGGIDTVPRSIVKWSTRILRGESPEALIKRIRPILALFVCEDHSLSKCEPCGY